MSVSASQSTEAPTAGSLFLDPEQHSIKIRNSAGFMVAQVHQYSNGVGPSRNDCERLAAIFVAAPELLSAAIAVVEACNPIPLTSAQHIAFAELTNAIHAAKGGA